ncbi:unnamed protein product, partial [Brachionus calyciflorus]
SWLGVANQYRKYIQNYADIAKPLYDLIGLKDVPKQFRKKNGAVNGKRVPIEWNQTAETNFEILKQTLCSELVLLTLINFEKKMHITTDASENGYGAVLKQEKGDGIFRPIAFFSKNYTKAQKKDSTSEKELLALVVLIEYFHEYFYGKLFTVNTDHLPLTLLQTKKNVHPRLKRWLLRLSLYEFEINYKPGKENIVGDGLSRLPVEEEINRDLNDDYFDSLIAIIDEININDETFSSSSNNSSEEFS